MMHMYGCILLEPHAVYNIHNSRKRISTVLDHMHVRIHKILPQNHLAERAPSMFYTIELILNCSIDPCLAQENSCKLS